MENNNNLLSTKFSINHIYRLKAIARSKLFGLLDESANSKMTFISAPAGFGKTTLLSTWITMRKKRSIHTAWLNLDEEDNDETRFWLYFVSAIQAVVPDIGEKTLKLLKSSRMGGIETVITVLINEVQNTKKKFLFIIEDLHVIKNKEILKGLKFFTKHVSSNIHLIITSRTAVSSFIWGIKAGERIIKIGQEDLRFTDEETAAFINEMMELGASEGELKRLHELTEGWPAGLQLAASYCKRKGLEAIRDKKGIMFQKEFADYFIEDTLNSQTPDVYDFLLKTSLFDVFSEELCRVVTGVPDCRNILSQVMEMNLFISCLAEKENWYRYHSLFRNSLKKKLEEEQPELVRELYSKAGEWYEKKGYKQEAGSCYLKGENFEKAVKLMEEDSRELIYGGQFTILEKWIDAIPAQYLYKSPRLLLNAAWICLSKYKNAEAGYYIETLEKQLKKTQKDEGTFLGEFLIAKAFVIMEHLEESIELLKRSIKLVDPFNPNYPAALMSIATSYITHGKLREAEQYYCDALTASKKIENLYSAAYSWGSLGMMMTCQGRFREAETLYQEAEEYLKEKGGNSISLLGLVFSGLSEIYYFRNQIDEAYRFSLKAEELFERGGIFDIKNNCYVIKARVLLAKGNKLKAIEAMDKAMRLSEKDKVYGFKRHIEFCRARMFVDMDSLNAAEDFIEQYHLNLEEPIERYDLHDYILLAEVFVRTGQFDKGISCIDKIMACGTSGKLYETELNMLKADALFNSLETEKAYKLLHKSLKECAKENYIRLFINYGSRIKRLLKAFINDEKGRSDSLSIEYAESILKFLENKPVKKLKQHDILTKRELEVLELISKGASNEEIAKKMFISVSTVKSHTLNLFGKLEVNSRAKAVVEAEKRGIIHTFY